jgi:threonyl-tRNA synthetase
MIHRALFGSIERFFGVLTEHYAGAFPAWLAPVQVIGIPIRSEAASDQADHVAYLKSFVDTLREHGIRAEVDTGDDRMQKKIRNAQGLKIPFMVIAGDQDVADSTVSFRYRDGSQQNGVGLREAVDHVVGIVRSRSNVPPSAAPAVDAAEAAADAT